MSWFDLLHISAEYGLQQTLRKTFPFKDFFVCLIMYVHFKAIAGQMKVVRPK